MAPERDADAALFAQGEVIALTDVVEIVALDHQVMGRAPSGLDEGDRVVTWIGVEEEGAEWPQHEVAEPEPEHVPIEWHRVVDVLHVQDRVAHAERSGAKSGNGASRYERIGGGLGAVKYFEPVAQRIGKSDQVLYVALVGQCVS